VPGSVQVLTGGPRLRLAAWGLVRWESGSPGEKLIHCLYQSWGGEQRGGGVVDTPREIWGIMAHLLLSPQVTFPPVTQPEPKSTSQLSV
jgi:hypothetical protein